MGRPNWYYDHWPSCTCAECEKKRMYSHRGYYQERRTPNVILTVFVALFILGIAIIALTFAGFEPLLPLRNAILGFSTTPTIDQQASNPSTADIKQPQNPTITDTKQAPTPPKAEPPPQPPPDKGSPGPAVSEKPSAINIADLEKQIHNLVNLERSKNGLVVVAWDAELSTVARKHSEDMAKRNYFNHVSPEGYRAVDRCKLAGINISKTQGDGVYYLGCSENIFQCSLVKVYYYNKNGVLAYSEYYSQSEIAELAVQGWMSSKGHRDNILTRFWRTEGIGIAISDGGDVYITQNFN